jgi:prepilin-type N-terminal cleavage/methylation domain-containing protein
MQRSFVSQQTNIDPRGVTLTEVLISMMIMSVGVLMVMSLFPVAALRTLQATQLTNATILRYNVEALIAQDPSLVFDPDRDANGPTALKQLIAGGNATPTMTEVANQVRFNLDEHTQTQALRNYIVDPLGYHTFNTDGLPTIASAFGNDGAATPAPLIGFSIPRYDGGLSILSGTDDLVALQLLATNFPSQPDGWSTDFDTFATGLETDGTGIVGVKLGNLDSAALVNMGSSASASGTYFGKIPDPEQYRIVVFDGDERISQAFPLTYLDRENGSDLEIQTPDSDVEASWSEISVGDGDDFNLTGRKEARYLPAEFGGTVGRVLLQSRRNSEFSWMLSVRRRADGKTRSVHVVVRFKNGVDAKDEELFRANCLGGTNIIGVKNNGASEPRLKRGGFSFDVVNGVWYRITSVQEKPAADFDGGTFDWDVYDYRVTVETAIRRLERTGADSADDPFLNGSDTSAFGRMMFPTGVIEVYPLGSMKFPDSLQPGLLQ